MYLYLLVCTCLYLCVLACTCMYLLGLACTSLRLLGLACKRLVLLQRLGHLAAAWSCLLFFVIRLSFWKQTEIWPPKTLGSSTRWLRLLSSSQRWGYTLPFGIKFDPRWQCMKFISPNMHHGKLSIEFLRDSSEFDSVYENRMKLDPPKVIHRLPEGFCRIPNGAGSKIILVLQ